MRQCTSVTDRRTDGLASWHKREIYILHLALKTIEPILMKCSTLSRIANQTMQAIKITRFLKCEMATATKLQKNCDIFTMY